MATTMLETQTDLDNRVLQPTCQRATPRAGRAGRGPAGWSTGFSLLFVRGSLKAGLQHRGLGSTTPFPPRAYGPPMATCGRRDVPRRRGNSLGNATVREGYLNALTRPVNRPAEDFSPTVRGERPEEHWPWPFGIFRRPRYHAGAPHAPLNSVPRDVPCRSRRSVPPNSSSTPPFCALTWRRWRRTSPRWPRRSASAASSGGHMPSVTRRRPLRTVN